MVNIYPNLQKSILRFPPHQLLNRQASKPIYYHLFLVSKRLQPLDAGAPARNHAQLSAAS